MTVGKQERDVTDNKMLSVIPVAGIFFKFLLFNAIWCYYTTFTPFSCWESYATAFVATLLLSVPYILTRHIAAGACHVCAGYMDGCQPDVLPYLFFSHSSVKLYVGGKSCRLPAKRDRFITMV